MFLLNILYIQCYYVFCSLVYKWANDSINNIYDKVIIFSPIPIKQNDDKFREEWLQHIQDVEFQNIELLEEEHFFMLSYIHLKTMEKQN